MADFKYIARTASGERIDGVIEADSENAALRLLDERSLFPIEVAAAEKKRPLEKRGTRVRPRDLGVIYGQLADLLNSGVPLLRSLDSLIRSATKTNQREMLQQIRDAVADGTSLTEALKDHPETFSTLHIAMIQAGERASFLEDVLTSLAGFIERIDDLRGKVTGAMVYPALLMFMGTVIMIAALIFFVPRFEPLLEGIEKPLPTAILFGMSTILRYYWFAVAVVLTVLLIGAIAGLRSPVGRRLFEVWRLKIPVLGGAIRMVAISRFCRILGTMINNGVPLLQALAISKDATGSSLLAERIEEATESVRAGESLNEPLGKGGLFPPQVLSMIAVAEESNQLSKVLVQIADTVERRTHRQVDQAVRLVEPVILCVVAAAIGFLALGLLLPIFTLAGSLGQN
jgi:general secretion pathway protein F/type IV pilus assembly protein PilC